MSSLSREIFHSNVVFVQEHRIRSRTEEVKCAVTLSRSRQSEKTQSQLMQRGIGRQHRVLGLMVSNLKTKV
jgi:hypothetical protein